MNFKILITGLILIWGLTLTAQNSATDTSTTFVTYWNEGETKILKIEQSKEKVQNNQTTKGGSTYEAHIKIESATDSSYTINWTYKNIQTSEDENPIVASMAKMTEGLNVIYKTDEVGIFSELVNWEEIRDYLNSALDKMLEEFDGNPQVAAVFNQVKAVFQSKQAIESAVIKDVQLYHSPYGAEYNLDEKLEIETQLPNILGGAPFPAILSIQLTEIDLKSDNCRLTMHQEIDKEKGMEIIMEFVNKLASSMGTPMPKDQEIPAFQITDDYSYEMQISTGWINSVNYKRVTENSMIKQTETMKIKIQ